MINSLPLSCSPVVPGEMWFDLARRILSERWEDEVCGLDTPSRTVQDIWVHFFREEHKFHAVEIEIMTS